MNGAVTYGLSWMFFSFTPGPDGVGGTFEGSAQVNAASLDSRAVITGILKDMVRVLDGSCGPSHVMTSIMCRSNVHQQQSDCLLHSLRKEFDKKLN